MARELTAAKADDGDPVPLEPLTGKWSNTGKSTGRGWIVVALPFGDSADSGPDCRASMNRYDEAPKFMLADKRVPDRDIGVGSGRSVSADRLVVTRDYERTIEQIEADDCPKGGHAGGPN
ncbi:MAG: hypothetical protein F4089_09530 [Gammaproteobacteria bacterium]|nr:hypothetical protein [Gammaproteobacteria bacterium]